jgi:hypothetical protein
MGAVIPVAERFCGQSPRIALSGGSLLAEVSAIDCTKLPLNPSMQSRRRDYIEFCTVVVNQWRGTSTSWKPNSTRQERSHCWAWRITGLCHCAIPGQQRTNEGSANVTGVVAKRRRAVRTTRINPRVALLPHRDRYCLNSGYDAALRHLKRWAKTCRPRCKKGRGKLIPSEISEMQPVPMRP